MGEARQRDKRAPGSLPRMVLHGASLGWLLIRVAAFTVWALLLFMVVFLGYFTLPFLFVGGSLLLLAISSWAPRTRGAVGRGFSRIARGPRG